MHLKTIHELQIPVLILDAIRQIHLRLMSSPVVFSDLRMQNWLMGRPFQLEIDVRYLLGEVL